MTRGVQTWAQDLPECSAQFVCAQARLTGKGDLSNAFAEVAAKQDYVDAEQVNRQGPIDKPKRTGGAWRAYVRARPLGVRGGIHNQKDFSKDYHALPPEEVCRLRRIGREATANPSQGLGSSFGLRTRDVDRIQAKRRKVACASLAIASHGDAKRSFSELCDIAVTQVLRRTPSAALSQLLTDARGVLAISRRAQAEAQQRHNQQLSSWIETIGPHVRSMAARCLPTLQPCMSSMVPLPSTDQMIFEYIPNLLGAASVATSCSENARRSNVARVLDMDWLSKHQAIMHDHTKPIAKEPRSTRDPHALCRKVGFCIGDDQGKLRKRMRHIFYSKVNANCKPQTPGHIDAILFQPLESNLSH